MTGIPARTQLAIVVASGVAVSLAAAWYVPLTWPASAVTIPLLLAAVAALALAYGTERRAVRIIEDQQHQLGLAANLRLQIIGALSMAIDARHRSTHSIPREQAYAAALARAFGMSDEEVEGVRSAALLHDIGTLAVPDHILTKPGPLTAEELAKVSIHPQAGAGILASVSFPYPVASLVLCHHERWDGSGYPSGLSGNAIPLGARILACVDYFDALISDRPFRRAMSALEAIDVLWAEAGKALDPVVVARFVELWLALSRTADAEPAPRGSDEQARSLALPAVADGAAVFRDIARANSEILGLYELSRAIGATLGIADSMTVIAAQLQHVVPFGACALFLHESAEGLVRCRFATGVAADWLRRLTVPAGGGVVGRVVANRACVINEDPGIDVALAGLDGDAMPFHAVLACPLVAGGTVIGGLALYHAERDAFTEDHRRLVRLVSEQAAAVIANSVVFERTQADSVTDALTGLPNIRLLFVHLGRELARASRLEDPLSLLLLDVDSLKEINDTFGHSAGDQALCKVATALAGAIRPYDLCVRYGGDEFIVVLSGCGRDAAEAKLGELRQAVDAVVFEVQGRQRVRLGISGGAAVFPQDGRTHEALLAAADRRMYGDKATRRAVRVDQSTAAPGTSRAAHTGGRHGSVSNVDLDRAAAGVL